MTQRVYATSSSVKTCCGTNAGMYQSLLAIVSAKSLYRSTFCFDVFIDNQSMVWKETTTHIKKRKPPLMFHLSSIKLGYNPLPTKENRSEKPKGHRMSFSFNRSIHLPPSVSFDVSQICPHASPSSFLSCKKMPVLRIRLRDPVPFGLLHPGSDFRDPEQVFLDPRSWMSDPGSQTHIFIYLFIQDPGSGINIPDLKNASFFLFLLFAPPPPP